MSDERMMRRVRWRWSRGQTIGQIADALEISAHEVCRLLLMQGIHPGFD